MKREDEEFNLNDVDYVDINIGDCRKQMTQVREFDELPLRHPDKFIKYGMSPSKGSVLRSSRYG